MQVGDNEPLVKLLEQVCEKLRDVMDSNRQVECGASATHSTYYDGQT